MLDPALAADLQRQWAGCSGEHAQSALEVSLGMRSAGSSTNGHRYLSLVWSVVGLAALTVRFVVRRDKQAETMSATIRATRTRLGSCRCSDCTV